MKRLIPFLLLAVIFASAAFASGTVFTDVKETDWFADAVSEAVSLGLVNGKSDNRFDPDGNITLAEAVKLAACMNQFRADGAVTLTNGDPWYETYAAYGKEHFLVSSGAGFSYDTVMSFPNKIISRAEFAWIFAHAVTDLTEVNCAIDLGTGAGFPGIPLKIAYPHLQITLVDSLGKRVRFLEEVIKHLGFDRISALHARAEDLGRNPKHREVYDLCVSRAVANLSTLCEYCLPFVRVNGEFISYKSGKAYHELEQSKKAVRAAAFI